MEHIVETTKPFARAAVDLESAVNRHGFGVLHVHDLGATLRGKGIAFAEECKIFEVCNPVQAARLLGAEMRLNMALPCRISVYTENGRTKIGYLRPTPMLAALTSDPALETVAREVEETLQLMVSEACGHASPVARSS